MKKFENLTLRKKNGAPDGKRLIVTWTEEAEKQFIKLKEIICSDLVLSLPDFEREMIITTDDIEIGYGAVLEQSFKVNEDGTEALRPIDYYSKNYTAAQKKYSTSQKELLAIIMAVEHYHSYIYGKKFTI